MTVSVAALAASAAAVATSVAVIGPFGGPLFGLAAGRSGELWVADGSVGVIPIPTASRARRSPCPARLT